MWGLCEPGQKCISCTVSLALPWRKRELEIKEFFFCLFGQPVSAHPASRVPRAEPGAGVVMSSRELCHSHRLCSDVTRLVGLPPPGRAGPLGSQTCLPGVGTPVLHDRGRGAHVALWMSLASGEMAPEDPSCKPRMPACQPRSGHPRLSLHRLGGSGSRDLKTFLCFIYFTTQVVTCVT